MKSKKLLIGLSVPVLLISAVIIYCDRSIADNAQGKLYTDTAVIPFNKVGLLLGTSKTSGGRANAYYNYRIKAAADLLKSGKVRYLVLRGDNGRESYNEPEAMRADLMAAGIDSSVLFLDYAGFRTFDSVKRLKEVFGQDSVTIISQQFHHERAIYTASRLKIAAIGFNAKDVSTTAGWRTKVREKLARLKVYIDFWFGKEPKFLGPKVSIPST